MLTDALIRGRQTICEENVSGIPFSPFPTSPPPPQKKNLTAG